MTPSQPVHLTRGQGLEPREMPHELKAGLEHRSEKGLKVYLGPRPRPGGREGSAQGPPQEHRPIPRTAPGAAEKPGPGLLTRWTHLPFSSIPRAHWPAKPRSHQESQPGNRLLQEEDEPEPLTPSEAGASESDTPGGAGTPRWARCSRPASAAPVSASPGQSPCPRPTRPCCGQVPGCGGCECKRAPPTPAALGTPHGCKRRPRAPSPRGADDSEPGTGEHPLPPEQACRQVPHPPSLPQRRGCGLREAARPRGDAGARSLDAAQGRAPTQPGSLRIPRQAASRPQTSALAGPAHRATRWPRSQPLDPGSLPSHHLPWSLKVSRAPPPPQLAAPA